MRIKRVKVIIMLYGNEMFFAIDKVFDDVDTSVDLHTIVEELNNYFTVELEKQNREIIFPNPKDKYYRSLKAIQKAMNELNCELNEIQEFY